MHWSQILFEPSDQICHGNLYETQVRPLGTLTDESEFVALNPIRERRADVNVTRYRNILVESDTLPVDIQLPRLRGLGLPFSAATFSGGKSVHVIISLQEPAADDAEYRILVGRVYKALDSLDFPVDPSAKNPSRFTRNPGHWRHDKGAEQALLYLGNRISKSNLLEWLGPYCPETPAPLRQPRSNWQRTLSGRTLNFLMGGARTGERHRAVISAALDMAECGYTPDECLTKLSRVPNLELDRTARGAVEWAFRRAGLSARI